MKGDNQTNKPEGKTNIIYILKDFKNAQFLIGVISGTTAYRDKKKSYRKPATSFSLRYVSRWEEKRVDVDVILTLMV